MLITRHLSRSMIQGCIFFGCALMGCVMMGCADEEPTAGACTAGATRACTCDGGEGTQDRSSAGIWSVCRECGNPQSDATSICDDGDKDPCVCEKGGAGERTINCDCEDCD